MAQRAHGATEPWGEKHNCVGGPQGLPGGNQYGIPRNSGAVVYRAHGAQLPEAGAVEGLQGHSGRSQANLLIKYRRRRH